MDLVLATFTLWLAMQVAGVWLSLPGWAWWLLAAIAGFGLKLALDGWSRSWLGLGLGGAAVFLTALSDLILVATDSVKVAVLRNSRGR
jgi:hypothetical protein